MSLTLEIVGPQAAKLGTAALKLFEDVGGSIGRATNNDWVIPDAYISGHHARIHFRDGRYLLEDTSTNGVFVKNPGNRLPKGQMHPLQTGDRLFIDAYEIKATVAESKPVSSSAVVPSSNMQPPQRSAIEKAVDNAIKKSADVARRTVAMERPVTEQMDVVDLTIPLPKPSDALADAALMAIDFDLFGDAESGSAAALPKSSASVAPPIIAATGKPKPSAPPPAQVPNRAVRPVSKPMAKRSATPPSPGLDLATLLAAAGVSEANITPDVTENFGHILRTVIAGVMDILHSREQIKDEFGIRMTSFKPVDNNPLKFSANVEDALHNLLVKRNAAYLGPADAFEDAFRDVRHHQMAVLAGMRVAFDAMCQSFNPDKLQESFNRQFKRPALLTVPIKLRYWELYREHFRHLAKDAGANFSDLFGNEFARAYAAQLEQLKSLDDKQKT